ncbi:MAG: VOC family protein [Pseudomonadota bacterium]
MIAASPKESVATQSIAAQGNAPAETTDPKPAIKVKGLAYVRVCAPDLVKAEAFLTEFGLQVAHRTDDSLFFRGTDPEPPCYILTRGRGGVTALGFSTDNAADLQTLARAPGASAVTTLDEPNGGEMVRLTDPQGMTIEVVHGRTAAAALEPAPIQPFNMNNQYHRQGQLPGVRRGPSHVKRIGHLVLESADPGAVYDWYHQHLGLRTSDAVRLPDGSPQMIFSRLDRGQEYVDHHVVGFQFAMDEGARVQHIAFEVSNLDDLMAGHEHLKKHRRKHIWGIGRHLLGGQIFDYWKSPWGVIHEHWTDTDLLNQDHQPQDCGVGDVNDYWGPNPTPAFIISRWNWKALRNVARLLRLRLSA